jgi:hypothetical protein
LFTAASLETGKVKALQFILIKRKDSYLVITLFSDGMRTAECEKTVSDIGLQRNEVPHKQAGHCWLLLSAWNIWHTPKRVQPSP